MELEVINIKKYIQLETLEFKKNYENSIESNDSNVDIVLDSEFTFLGTLWTGTFGNIILALHNPTNQTKTIKIISKQTALDHWRHVKTEKIIMAAVGTFPFIVKLEYMTKNDEWLYMIMSHVSVGNLLELINEEGHLNETTVRFFSSQILLALEFLHTLGLVHRNIKPENIFININGYLRLADFNMAKPIGRGRTYTLCGTPYYMAPEIITYKGHGLSVDFWSLGVLLYEMVAGYTPFFSQETSVLFENITLGKYKISKSFSPSFKNLIEGMIEVDLTKRLGNLKNGIADIKNHKWFEPIDWLTIINQKMESPYKPSIKLSLHNDDQKQFKKHGKELFDF